MLHLKTYNHSKRKHWFSKYGVKYFARKFSAPLKCTCLKYDGIVNKLAFWPTEYSQ